MGRACNGCESSACGFARLGGVAERATYAICEIISIFYIDRKSVENLLAILRFTFCRSEKRARIALTVSSLTAWLARHVRTAERLISIRGEFVVRKMHLFIVIAIIRGTIFT